MPSWFDILKLSFDFTEGDVDRPLSQGEYSVAYEPSSGKKIKGTEEIRVYYKAVYPWLKNKLNREPTDEELEEEVKQIIYHESGHAAHDIIDPKYNTPWSVRDQFAGYEDKQSWEKEWLAFTIQHGDNIYERTKSMLNYPNLPEEKKKKIMKLDEWLSSLTAGTPHNNSTSKNDIMQMHVKAVKRDRASRWNLEALKRRVEENPDLSTSPIVSGAFNAMYSSFPKTYHEAVNLYGSEHKKLLSELNFPRENWKQRLSNKFKEIRGHPTSQQEEEKLLDRADLTATEKIKYGPSMEFLERNKEEE